ncbi:MAG: tetratricopeptide repeat protein [Desulfobacterales bacterium]|nr:tetratricopeptide repeat protein [Desulfobacterales bacterium]
MPNEQKVTRKLRAILSADVKGYSILMADDEIFTIKTLKEYQNIISDCINQYNGRVVDSPGDNLLAEFASAVDVVQCAVDIQNKLKKENERLVKEKRLEFRIGINIGDVVHDGDRIYGDGVNIAARIEGLADPGGICVSRSAYDQIKKKVGFEYAYLGEHSVKNISEPVRIYKVLMTPVGAGKQIREEKKPSKLKWIVITGGSFVVIVLIILTGLYWKYIHLPTPENIDPENKMTFDLPKGPSIAVLPFDNMTGDPEEEFFCDGITENIISSLSQIPKLLVIARNSTFVFKGTKINIQQVGKELNAAYVIEGSIQKSKEQIRITVQLIDTKSGHHLWAEQYNRGLKDIFKLQDEITLSIMKAMQITLTGGAQFRTRFEGIDDLQVAIKLFKAFDYFFQLNAEGNNLSRQEILDIIDIDPKISNAYTLLAATYLQDLQYGTCKSNMICFGKATEAIRTALLLDENNSDAHLLIGWLFVMKKNHNNAIASLKRSISLNPNNADAYSMLGFILAMSDQPSEGIKYVKKAIFLNPFSPPFYYHHLGICYRDMKEYDKAIAAFKRSIQIQPDSILSPVGLIVTYNFSGQKEKAYKLGLDVLKLEPNFSAEKYVKAAPFKTRDQITRFKQALLNAGLPE